MAMAMAMAMGKTKRVRARMSNFIQAERLDKRNAKFAFGKAAVVGAASICLAVFSGAAAFSTIKGVPSALFAPANADAMAIRGDAALVDTQRSGNVAKAHTLARNALLTQGLHASALRIMAMTLGIDGSNARARDLIDVSSRVSRRDLGARIWRIEASVAKDDVAAALQEFDVALRTNNDAKALLFPILEKALSDAKIRENFAKYLRISPPWLTPFLNYAVDSGSNAAGLAQALQLQRPHLDPLFTQAIDSRLLVRLADQGEFAEMRRYFESTPGVDPRIMMSPALTSNAIDPKRTPISWQINESPDLIGVFDRQSSGSAALKFSALPNARGVIARKILFLKNGQYTIRAKYRYMIRPAGSSATLILGCKIGATDLLVFNRALDDKDVVSGGSIEFSIPGGCAAQYLSIEGVGGFQQTESNFSLDRIDLEAR
jgi:hypothetical protein